jgi:hypothetical protein
VKGKKSQRQIGWLSEVAMERRKVLIGGVITGAGELRRAIGTRYCSADRPPDGNGMKEESVSQT